MILSIGIVMDALAAVFIVSDFRIEGETQYFGMCVDVKWCVVQLHI